MRAEIEGGETIELAKWWHEYQFSNGEQREQLIQEQQRLHPKPKKNTTVHAVVKQRAQQNKGKDDYGIYCSR